MTDGAAARMHRVVLSRKREVELPSIGTYGGANPALGSTFEAVPTMIIRTSYTVPPMVYAHLALAVCAPRPWATRRDAQRPRSTGPL